MIKTPTYHLLFIVWIVFSSLLVLNTDKLLLHLQINSLNNEILDVFFQAITFLGDGYFALALVIFYLFKNARISLFLLLSFLLTGLFTQILKQFVFQDCHRPIYFFQQKDSFHFIQDFTYHSSNSFPSGHATSAFALATVLSIVLKLNSKWNILLFTATITTAFSRVYLSQHFLIDILAGSLIGYLGAVLVCWIFKNQFVSWNISILKMKSSNN